MARLVIDQITGTNPPQFVVRNLDKNQSAPQGVVPSPYDWPVPNTGDGCLMDKLRWYLETFIGYPFEPYTFTAGHIEKSLKDWGTAAFRALFNNLEAGRWLDLKAGTVLDILISCDSPELLSWPWEALCSPHLGYFGHRARICRKLNYDVPDPADLPELPQDRINILLVTARPYENDVGYRSISGPLVELIRKEKLPATVQVLRPPTLDNLRKHLDEKPGFYHILHFDGHGGYGASAPQPAPGLFQNFGGHEGRLLFEDEDGQPHEVTAHKLEAKLHGCTVPFVVLNACRAAKIDAQAVEGKAFASVAGALVHAGFRGVLAMGYNLTVTGAQQFLPPFYRQLFKKGNLLEAAREGRLEMHDKARRCGWDSTIELQDWILPVVYQQEEKFELQFERSATPPAPSLSLPEEARLPDIFNFVGRDGAVHDLERALRGTAAGVLVHGLGGVGKTTLARHFLQWLSDTGGLTHPPIWFSFDDIRSASFVLNQVGRALFGAQFDGEQKEHLQALIKVLREQVPLLLVWDNFESVCGFAAEHVGGLLSSADQQRLRDFLVALRGGRTKVLITSRSDEAWLPAENCRRIALQGLRGEEVWEYAAHVLDDLGLKADRNDKDLQALLKALEGHPVLIRAVLAQLSSQSAAQLGMQWQKNLPEYLAKIGDPSHAKLLASLKVVEGSLSVEEAACLIPIGLHERFVDLDHLQEMGKNVANYQPQQMEQVVQRLERSGLLTSLGQNIFSIHPLLTSYLRTRVVTGITAAGNEAWERAFVDVMGTLADDYAPKKLHEQRMVFHLHRVNFHRALALAGQWGMEVYLAALTQGLAAYAQNTRNYPEAKDLFQRLADHHQSKANAKGEAGAYHQLGMIAQEQRDLAGAEKWYLKSLAIKEKQGNEHGAAITYHQLGRITQEQRDFVGAEKWYLKSLAISEKQGNEHGAAITYHQLGRIAEEQRDFAGAEKWYLKSLAIEEKQGNEHGAAITYHQLGSISQEQRDFVGAEKWYLKSLAISEKQGNEDLMAMTYHQLGRIAQEQRDFAGAEKWYLKSLAIDEKQGNEHGAAITYHQLGSISQEQRDFVGAEKWYLKSLAIDEKQGNEHGSASTYHQLGIIAQEQRDFAGAEKWYLKSLAIEEKQGDEHGSASTYHQLGRLALAQKEYGRSGKFLLKAAAILAAKNDPHNAGIAMRSIVNLLREVPVAMRVQLLEEGRVALGVELMAEIEKAATEGKT